MPICKMGSPVRDGPAVTELERDGGVSLRTQREGPGGSWKQGNECASATKPLIVNYPITCCPGKNKMA